LDFNYEKALFCSIDVLYSKKYGIPEEIINNKIPKIVYKMKNPFRKNVKHNL